MIGCMYNKNMLANLKTAKDSTDFAEMVDKKLEEIVTKIDELNWSNVIWNYLVVLMLSKCKVHLNKTHGYE